MKPTEPAVFEEKLIRTLELRSGGCLHADGDWVPVTNKSKIRALKLQMDDCRLMPIVYPEEYEARFRNGESLEKLADEILELVRNTQESDCIPADFFQKYETVQKAIFCRVISADKNKELLRQIPHEIHTNLAIVYYYEIEEGWMEDATILIRNEHLKLWNRTSGDIKNTAWKNTLREKKVRFCKLSRILAEYGLEETEEMEKNPLYLLTSEQGSFGAVAAFYPSVLANCAGTIGSDLILLPSSIHEWLLLAADPEMMPQDADDLRSMVREINRTQLAEKEILSDEIYYYNAELDLIRLL